MESACVQDYSKYTVIAEQKRALIGKHVSGLQRVRLDGKV